MLEYDSGEDLRGEVSGYGRDSSPAVRVRDSRKRLIRWNSGTDGIVRMVEDHRGSQVDPVNPPGVPLEIT